MTDLEGLEALERISNHIEVCFDYSSDEDLSIIEKELKGKEELKKAFDALSKDHEKAMKELSLEIEKNRVVDIIRAKLVDFNRLNRAEYNWIDDGKSSPVEYYNEGLVPYCQLTEEEYNFLVVMVGIRDLDEDV